MVRKKKKKKKKKKQEKKKQEKKTVPQVAFFFSLCWRKCQQTNGHETSRRWIVFFAKRTCVSPAVVADQTAVLTDDSNEALSESDGSGTESQSGESESDVCSTACQNEDKAILDLEAETDGAAVSDTVTQSIRGYVDAARAALSGRSQSLSDTEKRFVIENKKPSEQTVLPSREYPDSRRKSGTSTRSLLLKWFDRYDWQAYFGKSGEEGVFCAPCVLFPIQHRQGSSRGDYFITKVHRDWKHTCGEAADHEALQYHRDAVAKMTAFMATDAVAFCLGSPSV